MDELDKHYITFDSPHIYRCKCGVMAYFFHDSGFKLAEMPKGKIEYLPCGHAKCASTERGCIICINQGL
jgi:hypothetical protein